MTDRGQLKPPVKSGRRSPPPGSPSRGRIVAIDEPDGSLLSTADLPDPADCLLRALGASDNRERRLYCQIGLQTPTLDDELEALLLRQLYLTELEEGNDTEALEIAERMVDLGTLGDIARQDAARAALALNAVDAAIDHITIAAHICPTERRSFHYCHLGAILRSRGRDLEAVEALRSAERFAQTDHPMYRAALALAENQESAQAPDWTALREQLEGIENKKGYLLWVLGEVCLKDGDRESGREYLTRFLERLDGAPRAKSLSLCSEIAHASELLHDSES